MQILQQMVNIYRLLSELTIFISNYRKETKHENNTKWIKGLSESRWKALK